jgi:hypothetical protein
VVDLPPALAYPAGQWRAQNVRVRGITERFGRHPHRIQAYGRVSSPEEHAYIAEGDFPHLVKASAASLTQRPNAPQASQWRSTPEAMKPL